MYKMYELENCITSFLLAKDEIKYNGNWRDIDLYRLTYQMLENAQYLYLESPKNTEDARKICQKAARLLRADLKKEEKLADEKELADVYAMLSNTYLTLDYGLKRNLPQAREQLKKQIELRENILKKEPDALNTFLYGHAVFDLGIVLERIARSTQGPDERRQGRELIEKSLEMARKEENRELEELIETRLLTILVYEMALNQEGYFDEPDFALALERLEQAWALVPVLYDNAVNYRDGFIFEMAMRVLERAPDIYEKAGQPEKAIDLLEQGLKWCRELLRERIANVEYWKEQKLQWAYDFWMFVYDLNKFYASLVMLYEEAHQKEKARQTLGQIEDFSLSSELIELKDHVERKQNYDLCQTRLNLSIAQGYDLLEDYSEAEKFYLKALEYLKQAQSKRKTAYGRRMLEGTFEALISLYEKMNQPKKAKKVELQQKKVLRALDRYEDNEDNFYDDERYPIPFLGFTQEVLDRMGEKAFDF